MKSTADFLIAELAASIKPIFRHGKMEPPSGSFRPDQPPRKEWGGTLLVRDISKTPEAGLPRANGAPGGAVSAILKENEIERY